jgi:hypothetical protein
LESEPEPLVSAGGPELAGVHGEEILPATSELPETQTAQHPINTNTISTRGERVLPATPIPNIPTTSVQFQPEKCVYHTNIHFNTINMTPIESDYLKYKY